MHLNRKCLLSLPLLLLLFVATTAASSPNTVGQPFVPKEKLFASNRETSASFGEALALSRDGQVMVSGAPLHNTNGNSNQGSAYVFWRNADDTWTEVQTLTVSDGAADDQFGTAVAIADGPDYTIVIGAPYREDNGLDNVGAAYLFAYNGSSWEPGVKLNISDPNEFSSDFRGTAVAITDDGTTVFVGAPNVRVGANTPGVVYVLEEDKGGWPLTQTIIGPTVGAAGMGKNIVVNDDSNLLFVTGSYAPAGPILDHGAVHIYEKPAATWLYDERLTPSDSLSNDAFGSGIAISNDETTLLIGAPGNGAGAAYLFAESGATWAETTILTKPAEFIYSTFGQSVALDAVGETAVVGAPLNGSGGIYYYEQNGANWDLRQTLRTADSRQEHLGYAVAMTNNADMVVGGARAAHAGTEYDPVGAVYTFIPGYQIFLPVMTR